MHIEPFELRQTMSERFYEFHYYCDSTPIEVKFHQHSFYEILFFLSGNANYNIEGKTYHLASGDIILINNTAIHRPEISTNVPYERVIIWLSNDFFDYLKDFCAEDFSACFKDASKKNHRLIRPDGQTLFKLKKLCEQMSYAKFSDKLGKVALTSAYLIEFLVCINQAYYNSSMSIKEDITENEQINNIIRYINDNLSENLSLDIIANKFFMSKYYLCKQFKKFTGLSVYQYIIKKRLIIARNMIRNNTPITEAYLQCGFTDYSNFLKAFKREFEQNPTEYVKENKN